MKQNTLFDKTLKFFQENIPAASEILDLQISEEPIQIRDEDGKKTIFQELTIKVKVGRQ